MSLNYFLLGTQNNNIRTVRQDRNEKTSGRVLMIDSTYTAFEYTAARNGLAERLTVNIQRCDIVKTFKTVSKDT